MCWFIIFTWDFIFLCVFRCNADDSFRFGLRRLRFHDARLGVNFWCFHFELMTGEYVFFFPNDYYTACVILWTHHFLSQVFSAQCGGGMCCSGGVRNNGHVAVWVLHDQLERTLDVCCVLLMRRNNIIDAFQVRAGRLGWEEAGGAPKPRWVSCTPTKSILRFGSKNWRNIFFPKVHGQSNLR